MHNNLESINELIHDKGRLKVQRDLAVRKLHDIEGIECFTPKGEMYCFAKVDAEKFNITNDEKMIIDLLNNEKILLVHGRAFNIQNGIYFRLVFLPHIDELGTALDRIGEFFSYYRQA